MQTPEKIEVFCGYAQTDRDWFDKFFAHLSPLLRKRDINLWHEQQILAGQDRQQEVLTHLEKADVIILLLSSDFLALWLCNGDEIQRIIQEKMQRVRVIPVLLSSCDWKSTFLEDLQVLPKNGRPIQSRAKSTDALSDVVDEIRIFLEKHWSTPPLPAENKPSVTRNEEKRRKWKYLEQVYKSYSSVTLPIGPPEGLSLQAIYQPLILRSDPLAAEDLERRQRRQLLGEGDEDADKGRRSHLQRESEESSHPVIADNAEDALNKIPEGRTKGSIVILGGPGTGKTTTLKHLVSRHAQQALEQAPDQSTVLLPIFISLPDLARSGKTLRSFLEDVVERLLVDRSFAAVLWDKIEQGQTFIALDSLDEVAPDQRTKIIEHINFLASTYDNIWLVGSRFTEYKGGQLTRKQFTEWELLSMTPQLRRKLANRLLPELTRSLPVAANILASDFVSQIENHSQAAAWGESPLLLSLASVVFAKTGKLPASRAALYRDIVKAILDFKRTDSRSALISLQNIFAAFSLWLYDKKRMQIFTINDLLTFLHQHPHSSKEVEKIAEKIIHSGMLDIVAQDTYGFRHRTFQEYLAAFELAQRLIDESSDIKQVARSFVRSKHTYSRWTEVLRLMVGVLQLYGIKGQAEAIDWLKWLVGQRSSEDGDPGDLGLKLALTSLAEIIDRGVWEAGMLKQVRELEDQVILLWVQKLLKAALNQRRPQLEKFQRLAIDVTHLYLAEKETTIDYLMEALKNSHQHVQRAAEETLKILGLWVPIDKWQALLEASSSSMRLLALQMLMKVGKKALPAKLLSDLVNDSDSRVREEAIKAFLALDDGLPPARMLSLLGHSDWQIRQFATTMLVKQNVQIPLERLLTLLGDSHSLLRQAAIKALEMVRKDLSAEYMLPLLENADWQMRRGAINALVLLGEQMPLHRFLDLLKDSDWRVRQMAVQASKTVKEGFPEEPVLSLLKDPEEQVRLTTMSVLVKQGRHLPVDRLFFILLEGSYSSVSRMAIDVLVKQGDYISTEHLFHLLEEDLHSSVHEWAMKTLTKQGDYVSTDRLLRLLKNAHALVRQMAIEMLVSRGERVPTDYLLHLLEEVDQGVCQTAIDVLVKQGDYIPTEHLLHLLEEDLRSSVHEWALKTLAKQGDYVSMDRLLRLLKNAHALVRQMAIEMLVSRSEHVPKEHLLELLKHPNQDVYRASIELLMRQGEWIPLNHLLSLLEDPPSSTCQAIIELLMRQGERISVDQLLTFLVQPDWKRRRIAVEMLIKQGKQMPSDSLLDLLKRPEASVKQSVIEIIAHQYEQVPMEIWSSLLEVPRSRICREVIQTLANLPVNSGPISDDYPDWQVCSAAIQVLRAQGKDVSLDCLLDLISGLGWEESRAARQEVERQVALFSVDRLVTLLNPSNRSVYLIAIEMLIQKGEDISLDHLFDLLESSSSWQNHSNTSAHLLAIEMLIQKGEDISLDHLFDLLKPSSNWQVHQAVGKVLEQRGENIPIDLLLGLLRDSNWQVHPAVGKILEQRGEDISIDLLLEWLSDSSSSVRQVAGKMLEQREGGIPIDLLFEWLNDSSPSVSQVAGKILARRKEDIPIDRLPNLLQPFDWQLRSIAIEALPKFKEQIAVVQWFTFLENSDWQVRQMAKDVLESLGEQVTDDVCLSLPGHSNWQVRLEAIAILEKRAESAPTDRLLDLLNDSDEYIQQGAIEVLRSLGEQVPAERWLTLLGYDHSSVRLTAINILRNQQVYPPSYVISSLLEDPDEQVRQVASKILEDLEIYRPIAIWLRRLEDTNLYIHQAAVEVLIKRNQEVSLDYLLQLLERSDPSLHSGIIRVVECLKEQMPVETWFVLRGHAHSSVRLIALQVIESQGAYLPLEDLCLLLEEDSDWQVQQVASRILRNMSPYWSIETWLHLLVYSNWYIQQVAVEVLIERNQQVSLDHLLQLLERSDSSLHPGIIRVVESLKGQVPVETWFVLRGHACLSVRLIALRVIENQGAYLPWEDLSLLLEDTHPQVRQVAIEILKHQEEQILIENWLELLKCSELSVRRIAMEFLENHREQVPPGCIFPLLEDVHVMSRMAVEFLKKEKKRISIHQLVPFLYQTKRELQELAMEVLEVLDEAVPHDILIDLLSYENSRVRQTALDIARKQNPEMLLALSSDADATLGGHISGRIFGTLAKVYIAESIGHLGVASPILLDMLARFLDWPDWQVRWQAVRSLGRIHRSIPNDAIQRLYELRRDPDLKMRAVREAADDALAEILSLETGIEDDEVRSALL